MVDGGVDDEPIEPARELRLVIEALDFLVEQDEGLLGRIQGFGGVARDAIGEAVNPVLVTVIEQPEGDLKLLAAKGLAAFHKLAIGINGHCVRSRTKGLPAVFSRFFRSPGTSWISEPWQACGDTTGRGLSAHD